MSQVSATHVAPVASAWNRSREPHGPPERRFEPRQPVLRIGLDGFVFASIFGVSSYGSKTSATDRNVKPPLPSRVSRPAPIRYAEFLRSRPMIDRRQVMALLAGFAATPALAQTE